MMNYNFFFDYYEDEITFDLRDPNSWLNREIELLLKIDNNYDDIQKIIKKI